MTAKNQQKQGRILEGGGIFWLARIYTPDSQQGRINFIHPRNLGVHYFNAMNVVALSIISISLLHLLLIQGVIYIGHMLIKS